MTALTPSPPDRGGSDVEPGKRTYRWLPADKHAVLIDKLRCGPPEPRVALDLPGMINIGEVK